jgi:outer membrane protein assembly factor BamB
MKSFNKVVSKKAISPKTLSLTPLKLSILALAIVGISACNDSKNNDSNNNDIASIAYGPLNNVQATAPVDATIDRILVAGQTGSIIQAMDPSTHIADSGISPATYILPNKSPATTPASLWRPDDVPTHVVEQSMNFEAKGFYALHGDTRNSDEVLSVAAPETQLNWIAEKNLFSYEGGVFDRNSHIYVVPVDPVENVYLVSIDGETGERRWALPGTRMGQAGAPLILPAQDGSEDDIVYIASYEYITAVTSTGKVLWDVETGLTAPEDATHTSTHNFGVNFHPQSNTLMVVFADGNIAIHDIETGRAKSDPYELPGSATKPTEFAVDYSVLEPFVHNGLSKLMANTQTFFDVLSMILGGGYEVSNYFAIDPNTGRIFVGATAPDEADGNVDGYSALGALYALELNDKNQLEILWRRDFVGGTAATPTLSFDGKVVYTADAVNKMLAIDSATGEPVWDFETGSGQVVGSIAVSREGKEIYVSTAIDIIKVLDMGSCAGNGTVCNEAVWVAKLDDAFDTSVLSAATPQAHMYNNVFKPALEGFYASTGVEGFEFQPMAGNMVLAGITANGIVAQAGYGYLSPLGKVMPFQISQVLLDRETGEIRYSAPGIEESVSVMATAPNGNLYMSNSPLRRILNVAMMRAVGYKANNDALRYFGNEALGGIAQFTQLEGSKIRVAEEAGLAASQRLENLIAKVGSLEVDAVNAEVARVKVLVDQIEQSLATATQALEIDEVQAAELQAILTSLKLLEASNLVATQQLLQDFLDSL